MQGKDHPRFRCLQKKLHELLSKEERMWRQCLRADWLKAGDQNTRYFHCRATQRKRRNYIHQLRDSNGSWTTCPSQVPSMFINFYTELFTTSLPNQIKQVVGGIQQVVTPEMNNFLTPWICAHRSEWSSEANVPDQGPWLRWPTPSIL